MQNLTTWRVEIEARMKKNGEVWTDIEGFVLEPNKDYNEGDASVDRKFDRGYGGEEGDFFTIWTKNYVYAPASYDGFEYVISLPRHPNNHATRHV
jgi:hypothetical protein